MASAKQLAARKKFARIMKSGDSRRKKRNQQKSQGLKNGNQQLKDEKRKQ